MTVNPFRTSPAYEAHLAAGAAFHINSAWRRVDYFAENETPEFEALRPAGYDGPAWSTAVVAEHHAVRTTAGLFDFSTFGKIEIAGPGAASLLEWVCSNRVTRGTGRITYTQMLNESGGVIGDFTVSQLGVDRFVATTNTGALAHDLEWITTQASDPAAPVEGPVTVTDVTNGWACFGLWGPLARDILQPLVDTSLATADFPYMHFRDATISGVAVRLARVTFVGELGWEIYVPTGYGRWLWQELSDAVSAAGGRRAAFICVDSLRAEKGYLYLGDDLTADRTPFESGLGKFVAMNKDFIGRSALEGATEPAELLQCVTVEEPNLVLRGGERVTGAGIDTQLTSGGISYTLGGAIGFAYLPADLPSGSRLSIEVDGRSLEATVSAQPLYDPTGAHFRG